MSSVVNRPNGHRWINYKFNGKRHTLRLGRVSDDAASEVKRKLDALIEYATLGLQPPPEVIAWRAGLSERLYACLVTAGLAPPRGPSTIDALVKAHDVALVARGVKPSTLINNRVLHANLRKHFGEQRKLTAIGTIDADQFRAFLVETGLAKATVSNRCRRARAIFKFALDNGWLTENPFRLIATGSEVNRERDRYILPEVFERILEQTTDYELKFLLALVRYCGLRCPSELQPLTWNSLDLANNVIVVYSPKTEAFESGRREVPLFKPLMPHLLAASERREGLLMFPRHQGTGQAIVGRLDVLCRKAGEVLWPKPFVNLRASAERDALAAGHQIEDVANWFGHSPQILLKHYSRLVKERQARGALRVVSEPINPKQETEVPFSPPRTE